MRLISLVAAACFALPAYSQDYLSVNSADSVAVVTDRLVAAIEEAGARVFARVDHGGGAASVDMALQDAELVVFGNPRLGTPALQDDIRAGLSLPLRVLVHEGAEGGAVLVWETPASMFERLDIAPDAAYIERMNGALQGLTAAAAAN